MRWILSLAVFCFCAAPLQGMAESSAKAPPETPQKESVYEAVTMRSLSKLYWAISKLDINNLEDIDNYLAINECDLYRDFYHNEFEWKDIRQSGQKYITDHKEEFPLKFEFIVPIHLGEYHLETQKFNIPPQDQIKGVNHFEVLAQNADKPVCDTPDRDIPNYPKGLYVEFNRPFVLEELPTPRKIAEAYIAERLQNFKALPVEKQTATNLQETRDAYIIINFKVLTYNGEFTPDSSTKLTKVFAIFDGYKVYGDKERTQLLLSEDYHRKKNRSAMELELRKQYKARLKKSP